MEENFKKRSETGKKAVNARWSKDYNSKEVIDSKETNAEGGVSSHSYTNRISDVYDSIAPVLSQNTIASQEKNTIENYTIE